MGKVFKLIALLITGLFLFSCHKTTKIGLIDELRTAPGYFKTLNKNSKSTKHYNFNKVEFFINATYKTLDYRLAYLKEYTQKFKISQAEQKNMYDKEASDAKNFTEFFITVFSSRDDINNLKDDKMWRLYLEGDDSNTRILPDKIEEIKSDTVLEYFYPQISPWTWNFIVRFPLGDVQAKDLNLLLATIRGEETFRWKLGYAYAK